MPVRAYSATVGGTVVVESGLEYDLLLDLDRDRDLTWFVSQPARLRLRGPGRTRWTHTPDLLSLSTDGRVMVWDVRPTARQDEKFLAVTEATAAACAAVGWDYRVFAGHVPARRYNLRWLSAYRRDLGWYEAALPDLQSLLADRSASIGEVLAADGGAGHLISAMWHWLWRGNLSTDLDRPLTTSTRISAG